MASEKEELVGPGFVILPKSGNEELYEEIEKHIKKQEVDGLIIHRPHLRVFELNDSSEKVFDCCGRMFEKKYAVYFLGKEMCLWCVRSLTPQVCPTHPPSRYRGHSRTNDGSNPFASYRTTFDKKWVKDHSPPPFPYSTLM